MIGEALRDLDIQAAAAAMGWGTATTGLETDVRTLGGGTGGTLGSEYRVTREGGGGAGEGSLCLNGFVCCTAHWRS